MSKIVVVDDEESIRNLCVSLFEREGHEVVTAASGDELFGVLRAANRPDLIVMDIRIPGEEGLSLLKMMPNQKDRRIPVVMYSGVITPEIERQAFEYGAIEVVQKANNAKELSDKVRRILQKKEKLQNRFENPEIIAKKKGKVMVVDDEEGVRALLADFFKKKGYDILAVNSGEQALQFFEKEKPEMILLDLALGNGVMGGIDVLKKVREIDPKVGVVVISGTNSENVANEAIQNGAYAFVTKPFDMKYLEMVVLTRLILSSEK